jgi:hypothetical protein
VGGKITEEKAEKPRSRPDIQRPQEGQNGPDGEGPPGVVRKERRPARAMRKTEDDEREVVRRECRVPYETVNILRQLLPEPDCRV